MTKPMVILAAGAAALLALGIVRAATITEKSGNSTATITQEPGTNIKRKVVKTPNGQTIVQQSGGNSVKFKQSGGGSSSVTQQGGSDNMDDADDMDCPDKGKSGAASKKSDDEDCPNL